jgi:membrane-associated phospholipid phosphatase
VLIPIFVAMSRIYRGMHHPLDAAGGVFVGVAAIVVVLFACRGAAAAAALRRSDSGNGSH